MAYVCVRIKRSKTSSFNNNNNNNNNNSKVFTSAFKNLNELTCHNEIKYNDDTNSRL